MVDILSFCPQCQAHILPNENFCPNCGYHIAEITQSISIGRQIYQYIFSFILPPFGLVWAFKYLRSGNSQQKRVGWVIIGLTILSIGLGIWWIVGFFQNLSQQYSSYSNMGI